MVPFRFLPLFALSNVVGVSDYAAGATDDNLKLWFDRPATRWEEEALPIGNGSMGAMLFGGIEVERIQFNEESLWIGNEDDTGAYQDFGEIRVTFGGTRLFSNPSNHATPANQSVRESADGNPETKWCMEHGGRFPILWQADMPEGEPPVSSYTLTSAEDVPDRDPSAWRLLGSADGITWKTLDERKDIPVWQDRRSPRTFRFSNTSAYRHYRFEFLATHGTPHFQLAEIALGPQSGPPPGPENYRRELDLNQSVHRVSFTKDGTRFTREAFASHPAQVIVVRFTADRPGALTCGIALTDAHETSYPSAPPPSYGGKNLTTAPGDFERLASATPPGLTIRGRFPGYTYAGGKSWQPLHREAGLRIVHEGGSVAVKNGALAVTKADSLTLLLAADTDYLQDRSRNWRGPLPGPAVAARLDSAAGRPYQDLLTEHTNDYRKLFDRVKISLGNKAAPDTPTDRRVARYKTSPDDRGLEELMFQYGRYLLVSSSREGGLPANLQGKWNNQNDPPWRCDYHTDVNVQMNYWMADVANLGECFEPYAKWLDSIRSVRTEATRKEFNTRGWLVRGELGLFGGSTWNWVPGCSAWMLQNSFDHFAFTQDREYLRKYAYPAMKEVCEYWLDRLKPLPDGSLVTPPGLSPEHGPVEEGISFDVQLVWDLFTNTIEAANALDTDREFRDLLSAKREKLVKPRIGKWGQLQEWMVDRDDPHNDHRHTSHLVAVFPGRQIAPAATPELAKAAGVSLDARGVKGDSCREWAFAWRMSIWARLANAEKAHAMYQGLLQHGILPNLYCSHPPFQIDGNLGCVAGVCEMLLQSHADAIDLLPALPAAWPEGHVTGLRARGGFEVDLAWSGGKLTQTTIRSITGGKAKIRCGGKSTTLDTAPGAAVTLTGDLAPVVR